MIARLPIIVIAVLFVAGAAHAQRVYRYHDESGVHVVQSVPADKVKYGYEVLDARSLRVLEVQPPALTPAQAEVARRRDQQLAVCKDRMRRVRALYRDEADVQQARRQARDALESRIAHARAAISHLEEQQIGLQARAASLERSGVEPPRDLLDNIERTAGEIVLLEREVEQRHVDQRVASAQFEEDLLLLSAPGCEALVDGGQANAALSSADH
jgi:hypothetical protein